MWILSLLLSLVLGWLLTRTLSASAWTGPRWCAWLTELSLATLFGPGLASLLYFALLLGHAAKGITVLICLASLTAISAGVFWKFKAARPDVSARSGFRWTWVLLVGLVIGLFFFLLDFQASSMSNPNGEWDATAIWNLRARYLAAGGDTWRRAISQEIGGHMIGAAHPGYPLFLSSFIAAQWVSGDTLDAAAPIATSLLFSLGAFLLLGSSIASRRSVALGAFGMLVLLSSEVFAAQAASQYSDLLLGLAMLAAAVLWEAARSTPEAETRLLVAAGLATGLAPWIKNEGLPFAVAGLAVVLWRFRLKGFLAAFCGAIPGLAATLVLKSMAQGREEFIPRTIGEALSKLAQPGRWIDSILGIVRGVYQTGDPWSHPIVLLALLAMALQFIPKAQRHARYWLIIPVGVALGAEFGAYLITTADLMWHIGTTISRFLAQVWPSFIWLVLMHLRTPEEPFSVN